MNAPQEFYHFSALSPEAQEKAIDHFQDINVDYEWWDYVLEDFEQICKLIGVELKQKPVRLTDRNIRYEPAIEFSGFYSQGDGACFEGDYSYAKGSAKAIKDYAPEDAELQEIAFNLQALQRKNFYGLTATIEKRSYPYSHEHSVRITVDDCNADTAEAIASELRSLMRWLFARLRAVYEYLTGAEAIQESIEANEYVFDAGGNVKSRGI